MARRETQYNAKPQFYDGKHFASITKLAEYLNVNYDKFSAAMRATSNDVDLALKKMRGEYKVTRAKTPYKKPQFAEGQHFESISKLQNYISDKYGFVSYSTLTQYIAKFGDADGAIKRIKELKGIK